MTKEFKDWLDEFVDNGANPKDVTNWPEEAGGTVELQDKTVSPTTIRQEITADEGYDGLGTVTVEAIELQNKTVSPTTVSQEVEVDADYDGLGKVTVEAIELQDKTVAPTTIRQEIVADENYDGLGTVTVNAVTNAIDENIVSGNIKKDVAVLGVTGTYDGEPVELQDKTVSPTTESQNVTADEGYDGLGTVIVNAVTSAIDQNIIAENIKKDVNILGVTGTYEETVELQDKTVSPSTNTQKITPDEGYDGLSKVTVNAVTGAIDSNIKAENIKKDIAILGVTGTYDGGGGTTYTCGYISTQLPRKFFDMGVATVGSNVYIFGGMRKEHNIHDYIYKFDVDTETITTLSTTLPKGIYSMGVGQVGSNIYLFGGYSENGSEKTIYKFNTKTETIAALPASLPEELYAMSTTAVGDNIYLFGGYNSSAVNTIYKFDTNTEAITALSVTLPQTLSGLGVATVGSNVYIFGGYNSSSRIRVNTIYKFDVDTETITTLSTTLPYGLTDTGTATVGSNIYLFGGSNASGSYGNVDIICKFNTETETTTRLSTKLTTNIDGLRAAAVGSKVYLFGGDPTYTPDKTTIEKFTIDF